MELEQVQTIWGPMRVLPNDIGVSKALRDFGEYAVVEIATYRRLLEPGDVFVDVGANIGAISCGVAAAESRPRVIGFEPNLAAYSVLLANTAERRDMTFYPFAVSDSDGLTTIPEVDAAWTGNLGGLTAAGPVGLPCPTVRLDGFLRERAPAPRVVKIDVEGMEVAALRGLRGLFHDRLVVSVEADRRHLVPALLEELRDFTVFALFFRVIRSINPRFDPALRHCRTRHVQLFGFAGSPPDWVSEDRGMWRIGSASDFDTLWVKYFGTELSVP